MHDMQFALPGGQLGVLPRRAQQGVGLGPRTRTAQERPQCTAEAGSDRVSGGRNQGCQGEILEWFHEAAGRAPRGHGRVQAGSGDDHEVCREGQGGRVPRYEGGQAQAPGDLKTYMGKKVQDERTAVETIREKLREREEALQEDEVKLAAFEEDCDAAVEDVRDARRQAGQPPDEGEHGQTADWDKTAPSEHASREAPGPQPGPPPAQSHSMQLKSASKQPNRWQERQSSKKARVDEGAGDTQMEEGES